MGSFPFKAIFSPGYFFNIRYLIAAALCIEFYSLHYSALDFQLLSTLQFLFFSFILFFEA